MKQHTSVLMLLSRSTIYPLLLRLIGMILVECGLFYLVMQRKWSLVCEGKIALEGLLSESGIYLVFLFVLFQTIGVLSEVGVEKGSKVGYTLRRLSVSEKTVVLWHWGYNSICYLLLWWVQALTALGLCLWYVKAAPAEVVNHQTIMLACYRNMPLYLLFPLANVLGWMRNLSLVAALGLLTAKFPYLSRRGKNNSWYIVLLLVCCFPVNSSSPQADIMVIAAALLVCVVSAATLLRGEDIQDEELPEPEA